MADNEYDKHRILYVGPVGTTIAATIAAFAALMVGEVWRIVGSSREFDWEPILRGTIGTAIAVAIAAIAFNIIAPMIGGVPLWLGRPEKKLEE